MTQGLLGSKLVISGIPAGAARSWWSFLFALVALGCGGRADRTAASALDAGSQARAMPSRPPPKQLTPSRPQPLSTEPAPTPMDARTGGDPPRTAPLRRAGEM